MQHIVHIFIGKELVGFRDKFAAIYRRFHFESEHSLIAILSLTEDEEGSYILTPDENGDSLDGVTVDRNDKQNALYNYFEDVYCRKVTVAHPGNQSMVVAIWAKLFLDDNFDIIRDLTAAISRCKSNFHIEVAGFTHDAVPCFIANPIERLSPDVYTAAFNKNIERLRSLRNDFRALRLITNRNMNNVSLDFDEEALARVCAEHAAVMCEHYLSIHRTVIDSAETPFETFGISSILFDVEYYKAYLKKRIIVDKMQQQGVDNHTFNINGLARKTNPILSETIDEIQDFKNRQAAHAKASLSIEGGATASNVVGKIDGEIREIMAKLEARINALLTSGRISIFESEALLSLILGEDSPMFDSSAVDAGEIILDDIIDEGAEFFVKLDPEAAILRAVSQNDIKQIRKRMRNIALANRQRQDRLKSLDVQIQDCSPSQRHLSDNRYNFDGTDYKVNLDIDREPLEQVYQPHDVTAVSIDLSSSFAPVRNQGKLGSCAAFAVSSVVEAMHPGDKRFSPAFLYWTAREEKDATTVDSGASLNDVIKAVKKNGVCVEDNMPYIADNYAMAPTEAAFKEALDCMVVEAKTVEPRLNDIKSALSDGYPVIIAAKIFDSFSDTRNGFVRHPSSRELIEDTCADNHGNHAMVVCGYSDKERILIVRNSWGKDFGNEGYCYMPYSYARKYILQACIITQITSPGSGQAVVPSDTINFALADSNIEAAILQHLIDEDNYNLQALADESARLRADWAHNVAMLGNMNNQAEIVNGSKQKIDESIMEEKFRISSLQTSKGNKLWEFKKNSIRQILISLGVSLVSWMVVYCVPTSSWTWAAAIFFSLVFLGLIGAYSYEWRKYRQDLRDEIQRHAIRINSLQQMKADRDILAHIYGTILRDAERYRLNLYHEFLTLNLFNQSWLSCYKKTKEELNDMTPVVPYPFLAVLENNLLDRYYLAWRQKLVSSINLHDIFTDFAQNKDLDLIIEKNDKLNQSIMRGLRNFSMKEYLTSGHDPAKWQFLPDTTKVSAVIPDLDARALPFCPYSNHTDAPAEKYIFIKDITDDEMNSFARHFGQKPMSVPTTDPYIIIILNTVRYNL